MQCYWERIGILGPTYRLLGSGWSNQDIATHVGRNQDAIDNCVQWLLQFLKLEDRAELVFVIGTERISTSRIAHRETTACRKAA
jgi:hypothetical protein